MIVFPDKDDVDIDRLLNKFEEANVDSDTDELMKFLRLLSRRLVKSQRRKKMKLWQIILVIFICFGFDIRLWACIFTIWTLS